MNTLKEQLSSGSVSSTKSLQNGIPTSLASPSSDSGANSLNTKLLNNNQLDEVNENKMEQNDQHHNNSNRSTPISCEKDGDLNVSNTSNSNTTNNNNIDGHSRTLNEEIAAKDKEVSRTKQIIFDYFIYILLLFETYGDGFRMVWI